ncbi:NAD(P)-dependent oxidoreductase [Catenuloplanes atrovinosus]|uniref:NADH-flavin reductase n=1 Tax=Catenuloplanes atrovinosus TaxID=137266 RepID=A0AAE3YKX1_9ACTN|nr:SDR family oxidoreductase [Catenuloplanes atrovinosus]MDR7274315.1 putative NADH-flavin reductase [Catenuloplanes atrovinosus]
MKITVLGATGGTGTHVLRQARAAGHDVTAVVRDPARLPDLPGLTVATATVTDPDAIGGAISGRDAVVSALGPRGLRAPTTICADGAAAAVAAMRRHGVRRLVVVSNSGMHVDDRDGPLTRYAVKPILKRVLAHAYADMRAMEDLVAATDLDWTIVRPPMLTDGPRTGRYRTELGRGVRGGNRISRADLADAVLRCLADPRTVRTTVAVAV